MAGDADVCGIDVESWRDHRQQFADDPRLHPEVRAPWRLRGIEVKPCAFAKIPVLCCAVDAGVARAGVRRDEHEAQFGGDPLCTCLDGEGFLGAGQTREVEEGGTRL